MVDFTFDVKPIISDRCFKCHGPDKNAIEGGLSLNSPEDAYKALGELKDHYAIVPKDIEKSTLIERIGLRSAHIRLITANEKVIMQPEALLEIRMRKCRFSATFSDREKSISGRK